MSDPRFPSVRHLPGLRLLLKQRAMVTALLGCGLLCGCIPVPRNSVRLPDLTVEVQDEHGAPLQGVSVRLATGSHPHAQWHDELFMTSDHEGRVSVSKKEEWEVVFPLLMHGVPYYYWTLCVEKPGFQTVVQEVETKQSAAQVSVVLLPGEAGPPCEDAWRWPRGGEVNVEDRATAESDRVPTPSAPEHPVPRESSLEDANPKVGEEPLPEVEAEQVPSD